MDPPWASATTTSRVIRRLIPIAEISINAQKEIIHAGDTYLYDAVLDADNTNQAIAIKVNGDNSETMRWSALVKLTEVTHT